MRASKQLRLILTILLLSSLGPGPTWGQAQQERQKSKVRGLYRDEPSQAAIKYSTGEADGMQITVYQLIGKKYAVVSPGKIFRAGDKIKLEFISNFDGYTYVLNLMPSGVRRIVFPYRQERNLIRAQQVVVVPPEGGLTFDNEKGTEVLQVIMARERIGFLDDAINQRDGYLDNSAAGAAAELASNAAKAPRGGITGDNIALALPPQSSGIRTRAVTIGPGNRRSNQGSVVAIPTNTGNGNKLQAGEVSVFEIRLNHR